MYGVK